MGCHPVAVVQYMFTHKQYLEQDSQHKYIEQHSQLKYIEQHSQHKYIEQHSQHKYKEQHSQHKYTEQHSQHKYIEQHNSLTRKSTDHTSSLQGIPWHLPYNWGKSMEKPVSVVGECQLARWKQNIQNRAYITIRIHKHNNKNT
jgi:hypothetical protein